MCRLPDLYFRCDRFVRDGFVRDGFVRDRFVRDGFVRDRFVRDVDLRRDIPPFTVRIDKKRTVGTTTPGGNENWSRGC